MSYLNPKGEHGLVRFLDGKFEEIYERGEESFRTQYMERYDVDGIIRVYRSYKAMYDAEGYIDYDDQISMVNELLMNILYFPSGMRRSMNTLWWTSSRTVLRNR